MLIIALGIGITCILISVIISYLLKFELKRTGFTESAMQNTRFIALGMLPISSVKAGVLVPSCKEPNTAKWSYLAKMYIFLIRTTLFLAIISIITGVVLELQQ